MLALSAVARNRPQEIYRALSSQAREQVVADELARLFDRDFGRKRWRDARLSAAESGAQPPT